jgi:hypothetical protein
MMTWSHPLHHPFTIMTTTTTTMTGLDQAATF